MKELHLRNVLIAGIVVAAMIGFVGGMTYGKSFVAKDASPRFSGRSGMMGQNGIGGQGGRQGATGQPRFAADGGFATGEVISFDENGITLKMPNGSTRIVILTPSVKATKTVEAAMTDIVVGDKVAIIGKANVDGSLTAETVQLNPPQGMMGARGGAGRLGDRGGNFEGGSTATGGLPTDAPQVAPAASGSTR